MEPRPNSTCLYLVRTRVKTHGRNGGSKSKASNAHRTTGMLRIRAAPPPVPVFCDARLLDLPLRTPVRTPSGAL